MPYRRHIPRNQRLDAHLYSIAGQPCFFTIRTTEGSRPFRDPKLADIAMTCLLDQRAKSLCQVDVFCIMPDHIHAVVTPMKDGASSLVYHDRFKGWCSRQIHLAGWEGTLWQPWSYDHLIRKDEDLQQIAQYVLHNPVRKGICLDPAEYRWCGIPEPLTVESLPT